MNLSDILEAAVYKELVRVDLPAKGSNQHEIDGVAALREFFGISGKSHGNITWHYFADDSEPVEDEGEFTFYDAREKHPTRTEWRLYYRGEFLNRASEGDVLILLKAKHPRAAVHALVFQRGSSWLLSAEKLFGVSNLNPANFEIFTQKSLASQRLGLVEERILEELGIEGLQIPTTQTDLELILEKFRGAFPTTKDMSAFARAQASDADMSRTDETLVRWLEREEQLFRALEKMTVEVRLRKGFADVDDFVSFSLSVQNRRKSRMGYSLQNQLAALFDLRRIKYEAQAVTEGKNKPDFIFPGSIQYHDRQFDSALLVMLGAKSTLKERWRQILTEAAKIPRKHLCTLEPGISTFQTDDIASHAVQLVIPEAFHKTYTDQQRRQLWTVSAFVEFVKAKQH
ncbi:MAG TPA: type II restriction endonuclease [Candidatus Sulfotelmatobacter sp.]|jgi:hypothetical protein|nr:type II restriction endonuclease [Candidatus Sulfotelmatobacter sp.]